MDIVLIEILGFAAGATTLISSVPQLIANLRDQDLALGQSLSATACNQQETLCGFSTVLRLVRPRWLPLRAYKALLS